MPPRGQAAQSEGTRLRSSRQQAGRQKVDEAVTDAFDSPVLEAINSDCATRFDRKVLWRSFKARCYSADQRVMRYLQLKPVKAAVWWQRPLVAFIVALVSLLWNIISQGSPVAKVIVVLAAAVMYVECRRPLGVEGWHPEAETEEQMSSQKRKGSKVAKRRAKGKDSTVSFQKRPDKSVQETSGTNSCDSKADDSKAGGSKADDDKADDSKADDSNADDSKADAAGTAASVPTLSLPTSDACDVWSRQSSGRSDYSALSRQSAHPRSNSGIEVMDMARSARKLSETPRASKYTSLQGGQLFEMQRELPLDSLDNGVLSDPGEMFTGTGMSSDSEGEPGFVPQYSVETGLPPDVSGRKNLRELKEATDLDSEEPLRERLKLSRFKKHSQMRRRLSTESRSTDDLSFFGSPSKGRKSIEHPEAVLQAELEACELELERLTERLKDLRTPTTSVDERRNRPNALHSGYPEWRSQCEELVHRLRTLSSEALECGCNRDTFGAMDVFEKANFGLCDTLARLLEQGAGAQVEASAPALCDAVEWRVVADAIGGSELKQLEELLLKVHDCDKHPACKSNGRMLNQSPATLLRFLRASDGNIQQASEMFHNSLHWRWKADTEEKHESWAAEVAAKATWRAKLVDQFKVHADLGADRFGLPVYLFRWSVFDVAGAERELGTDCVVQIMISIHEEIVRAMGSALLQRRQFAPGCMQVWDIGNYGQHGGANWWSRMLALVRFLPKVAKVMEQNYPEVVRKIIIVRSSTTTRMLYNTVTPFMPTKTLAKGRLFGWTPEEWLRELREEAPELTLPPFLESNQEEALAKAEPRGGIWSEGVAQAAQAAAEAAEEMEIQQTPR